MIYVNLRGNLGNQMFEYAFARSLQDKYGQKICINYYEMEKEHKEYTCLLENFKLNNNIVFESRKKLPYFANSQNLIPRILRKSFPKITFNIFKIFGIFIWLGNEFIDIPLKNHKNFYIDGYFQSEKYFKNISSIIKKEFSLKNNSKLLSTELFNNIANNEVTCITVRRGDYVTNKKFRDIFYVCDEDYFKKSLDYIKKEKWNNCFMLCSNDVQWVKDNFEFNGICFEQSNELNSVENLIIMSKCTNFIISNSTYSWWAQYLCDKNDKKVIAPSIWFRNGSKTDIYQPEWKLIKIEGGIK